MKSGVPPPPHETQPGLSWLSSIVSPASFPKFGEPQIEDAVVRVERAVHGVLRDEVDLGASRGPVLARGVAVGPCPRLVVRVPVGQRVERLAVGEVEVVEERLAPQRGHDAALLREVAGVARRARASGRPDPERAGARVDHRGGHVLHAQLRARRPRSGPRAARPRSRTGSRGSCGSGAGPAPVPLHSLFTAFCVADGTLAQCV